MTLCGGRAAAAKTRVMTAKMSAAERRKSMTVDEKLGVWRNDLLDMSRLNKLLYFSSGTRAASIQFLGDPDLLFTRVYAGRKPLAIDSAETALEDDDCRKRLSRLRSRAREALNDRGTHVLYMAFGMLEWQESAHATETIRSPLVLVPVSLTRQGLVGRFFLEREADEEVTVNLTLREKLRQEFQIALPAFADIESPEADDPALDDLPKRKLTLRDVCARLEVALPPALNCRIVREAHLGVFSFQKLVMYQDLQRRTPEALAHPLLRMLGGEATPLTRPRGAEIHAVELDERVHPHDTLEILDADSSQQEAIVAAKAGASYVLQGPPGTGKSQTIANILAECLGQGKRVLFVSEKMAALQVVEQRLQGAGLGDFLLDLHSHKADKKTLIAELRRMVNAVLDSSRGPDNEGKWRRDCDTLLATRQQLNTYVRELHAPRGPLAISAFTAYGELARLDATTNLDFALPAVERVTRADLDAWRSALQHLLNWQDVLDSFDSYPWRETLAGDYSYALGANISDHYAALADALSLAASALAALGDCLGESGSEPTFGWASLAVLRAHHASRSPLPPASWLASGETARVRALAEEARRQTARHEEARGRFEPFYLPAARALETTTLLAALTDEPSWAMTCLVARGDAPQDVAIRRRDALDGALSDAPGALSELEEAAQSVAAICEWPAPTTLAGVAELADVADCLLETPAPPAAWMVNAGFAEACAAGLDAAERYEACARTRRDLESIYAPDLFTLDVSALADHFQERYASPLRFLKPAYYADTKLVQEALLPGTSRTADQFAGDLAHAAALLAEQHRLDDARMEHARILGHLFTGPQTDWRRVRGAIAWTQRLYRLYPGESMPRAVARLVTGPASGLSALRAQRERLASALNAWQHPAEVLAATVKPQPLLDGAATFDRAPLSMLRSHVERLHVALRSYWSAADTVTACVRRPLGAAASDVPAWAALCTCLRLAQELDASDEWLKAHGDALANRLGRLYRGIQTDWTALDGALAWTDTLLALYAGRDVPAQLARTIADDGSAADRERLAAALAASERHLASVEEELRYSDTVLPQSVLLSDGMAPDDTPLPLLRERVLWHLEQLPCLERWIDCQRQRQLCAGLGLDDLLRAALRQSPFPRDIVAILEKRFYQLWLDAMVPHVSALAGFHGQTHEQIVARFRALDTAHALQARRRLQARLSRERDFAMFDSSRDDADTLTQSFALLRREVNKKRHRSIRQIVQATAPAMLMLKPCWMMSPLSVSQYLDSAEQLFDVVIFDEASQVCPEDAICAILRGKQLIVVGDSKQLPPTRFFAKSLADLDEDDDGVDTSAESERTESVLDECVAAGLPERRLRWHYRSRHESLIAFSNAHFYGGSLLTFPGLHANHADGVRYERVDGIYERGGSRQNWREAERVVDYIEAHLREEPEASLGVVALSEAQQSAVREALEQRLKASALLRAYEDTLDDDATDGFFIKNLETVQGDERDVIILTTGYGRDTNGKLSQNFGPVNRKGGERRLNVAITRARRRLIVVTSLRASELGDDLKSPGARALRDFLEYAEKGPEVLERQLRDGRLAVAPGQLRFDSPFEEAVYDALSAKGLTLGTQVGCSGYRIDLAVRDPRHPERYLLGIECDGASYHSSATARDRDRLRQEHLERMGWRIHRIWSRDWVRHPGGEVTRALHAVEVAQGAPAGGETATQPNVVVPAPAGRDRLAQ